MLDFADLDENTQVEATITMYFANSNPPSLEFPYKGSVGDLFLLAKSATQSIINDSPMILPLDNKCVIIGDKTQLSCIVIETTEIVEENSNA